MAKVLHVNVAANWGSHGRIIEGISQVIQREGWESHIAYGRYANPSTSQLYHIGNKVDKAIHLVSSRLWDNHGLMSGGATKRFISYIEQLRPDIVHLHNIHGYYLNYELLFEYLAQANIPVVWTLHDSWAYTGHCANYLAAGCERWKTHCDRCPQPKSYPKTSFISQAYRNFEKKRACFLSVRNLTLVPVSRWLEGELHQSFFRDTAIQQIHNGIDTDTFVPVAESSVIRAKYAIAMNQPVVLGVASVWYNKGFEDFIALRKLLAPHITIVLVGLTGKQKQIAKKNGIIAIDRTQSQSELAALYSTASVFCNPTWEESFGLTNVEAMACGTPVVTYNTGGSPEILTRETGRIVQPRDVNALAAAVMEVLSQPKDTFATSCRKHVLAKFDRNDRFDAYYQLYRKLLA